jgi:hypothetical protein
MAMTVDGSDERPLALRDLAQADSPEIVRAALGRFRRRLFTRGLILVLIVAVAVVLYPRYFPDVPDLSAEIEHGRGVVIYNATTERSIRADILRVARLSPEPVSAPGEKRVERFGIQLFVNGFAGHPDAQLVTLLRSDRPRGVLSFRTESGDLFVGGLQMWIALAAGTRTFDIPITYASLESGAPKVGEEIDTLHVDMEKLGVPEWIWR